MKIFSKKILLLSLSQLYHVTGRSIISHAFSITHELELQFDCEEGSVMAEEQLLVYGSPCLAASFCPGYANMLYKNPDSYGLPFSVDLDADTMVKAARDERTRYESQCESPAILVKIEHPAHGLTTSWGCPITEYKCSTNPSYFFQYDEGCLRNTIKTVTQFRAEIYPPLGDKCRNLTAGIEVDHKLHEAYMAIDLTRLVIEQSADSVDSDTELVQYETNAATVQAYENLCVEANGQFRQIDFRARCVGWWCEDGVDGYSCDGYGFLDIMVGGRPRCYSVECSPEDDEGLLRAQTLLETEERFEREYPGITIRCIGDIERDDKFSVCLTHTDSILKDSSVKDKTDTWRMQAVVSPKKEKKFLLWESNVEGESTVAFPEAHEHVLAVFEEACTSANGNYQVADEFTLRCEERSVRNKDEIKVEQVWKYDVSGLPVCLSDLCYEDEEAENAHLLEKISKDSSRKKTKSDSEWICTRSNSGALILSTAVLSSLATLVATIWSL